MQITTATVEDFDIVAVHIDQDDPHLPRTLIIHTTVGPTFAVAVALGLAEGHVVKAVNETTAEMLQRACPILDTRHAEGLRSGLLSPLSAEDALLVLALQWAEDNLGAGL